MNTISEKYEQLGGYNSFLRNPIEDEHKNPDGIGRCRHFEDGAIYWHPEIGAYEVHGAINTKWMELGGLSGVLGYPTSDELIAGNGHGRCNCFQKGRIYWTPEAGAWHTDLSSDKAMLDWVSFTAKPLPDDWLTKNKDVAPPQKVDYSPDINFTRNQGNKSGGGGGGYGCMTYAFLHILDILKDWEHPYSPAVSWHYAEWKNVDYRLKHSGTEWPGFAWVGETGYASEGTCQTNWDTEHQLRGSFPDGWPIPAWNEPSQTAKNETSLHRVKVGSTKQVKSGTPSPSLEEIKQFLRIYGPVWCSGAGHAKAIVGYDDTTQQFKILNSYVHNESVDGGRNITYIPYSHVQPDGEISEFFEIVNLPTEQRVTGRYAYSARIQIRNNWRGTYTVSLGVEGKQPVVIWTTRGRDRNVGNYSRYNWQQDKVDDGYPLPISAWHLPGNFASGIDAALNGQGQYAGKAYFFKGDQYVRYDWQQDKVDDGYPLPISAWHLPGNFASGIDAALNGQGQYAGKAYFFKGNQYVRYDWQQDKVDDGYPLPISAWHLPGNFASGIDAALNGQGQYAGKAYFFKGDQYVRYDWQQDKVDDGYPLPITAWHLSQNFNWGVDAALNGQGSYAGKAYFFRRDFVPLETSKVLAIDVLLPDYAASYWPPSSSHRWFLKVEDHDRDGTTGQITEFTLARRYVYSDCHSVGKYRTETFGQPVSSPVPDPTTGQSYSPINPLNPPEMPNPNPGTATVYVSASGTVNPFPQIIRHFSMSLTGDAAHSPAGKITLSGQLKMTLPIPGPLANRKVELFELDAHAINKPSKWWVLRGSTNTKNDGTFQFEVEAQPSPGLQTYAVAFSDQGQVLASSDCLVVEYRLEGHPFPLPKILIKQKSLPEAWAEMQKLLP